MTGPPAPLRTWVCFYPDPGSTRAPPGGKTRWDRYQIESISVLRGAEPTGIQEGGWLVRTESEQEPTAKACELVGVTQHLTYTHAPERRELTGISAAESGPVAVLIPISKSAAWWALAQDERDALFRGKRERPGHLAVGRGYASRVFRKLYHARYVPGSHWDFLTYFEFPKERADDFRALVAELRDPATNPEWEFVERETEIWLQKQF